ncbi:hypothetical protein VDGL01_06693 [Verticillium dahliae]
MYIRQTPCLHCVCAGLCISRLHLYRISSHHHEFSRVQPFDIGSPVPSLALLFTASCNSKTANSTRHTAHGTPSNTLPIQTSNLLKAQHRDQNSLERAPPPAPLADPSTLQHMHSSFFRGQLNWELPA